MKIYKAEDKELRREAYLIFYGLFLLALTGYLEDLSYTLVFMYGVMFGGGVIWLDGLRPTKKE